VCLAWSQAARADELWSVKCGDLITRCRQLTSSVIRRVAALKTRYSVQASKERLEFLQGTVQLMREYFQKQLEKEFWATFRNCKFACHMVHCVFKQLCETSDMLESLESGRFKITVNFDIFELSLRRYYEELKSMLPLSKSNDRGSSSYTEVSVEDSRLSVLQDSESRDLWAQKIGPKCYCHFDDFYEKLLSQIGTFKDVRDKGRFREHMKHYLNFPRDNLLTTYRFHVLVSLFGPLTAVALNFETYVLCQGFLGLINMIKAEEILRQEKPKVDTVLIRFSRQRPTYLAFTSFSVKTRTIEHRRNSDKAGHPIPIATFLKEQYPGYQLIGMGVDDMATKADSTFVYATEDNPYCSYPDHHF